MSLHFTRHALDMMEKRSIKQQWIEDAFLNPDKTENDPLDKTAMHYMKRIHENGDRILRVVVNVNVSPNAIVTAFFDRGMKGKL